MNNHQSKRLPASARWTLSSIFITNVGNGMHTLAVGKLLYDKTGSAAAFGAVFVIEYLINFVVQLSAGPLVDRNRPKLVLVTTDLVRGSFILLSSVMIALSYNLYGWVLASIFIINVGKPFFRSATFTVGPTIVPDRLLMKYNSYYDGLQQSGQLIGIAFVGIIIKYYSIVVPFALNGLSYLIAASIIYFVHLPETEKKLPTASSWITKLYEDWKEIGVLFLANTSFLFHIMLASIDYVAVNLLELLVIPAVNDWHNGNTFWLSGFNGAFAIGATVGAIFIADVIRRLGNRLSPFLGLLGQSTCFFSLAFMRNPWHSLFVIFLLGIFNTLSFTCFISALQRRSTGPIKGRIASIRNLATGMMAAIMIPIVTYAQNFATKYAFETVSAILLVFSLFIFALSSKYFYGPNLLGSEVTK